MQGQWKNEVGGWNNKDTRRKKQKMNHILKDRGLHFSRKEPTKTVRYESDTEHTEHTFVKHGKTRNIYNIRINKSYFGDFSNRVAWNYGTERYPEWYDAYTNQRIYSWGYTIDIVDIAWQEYTHFEEPKVYSSGYSRCWHYSTTLMFVYDKPVYNWKSQTFYDDGKRRKYAQKFANSTDRANIRAYITKGDWDAEVKSHAYSKSIAWLVH